MKSVLFLTESESIFTHWKEALKGSGCGVARIKDAASCNRYFSRYKNAIVLIQLGSYGIQVQKFIKDVNEFFPGVKIMCMSDLPSFEEGYPLVTAGIKGYGNSRMASVHLKQAIEIIDAGNLWFYPEFMASLIKNSNRPAASKNENIGRLTERENEIAGLVSKGLSNRDIAEQAGISERTVKAHLTSIFEKLEVSDRLSLALVYK